MTPAFPSPSKGERVRVRGRTNLSPVPGQPLTLALSPLTQGEGITSAMERAARHAITARGRFTCALTGGSAATTLYPRLATADLDWSRTDFFLSDERCVPLDHPDSNYRVLREALPRARLHPVHTSLPPDQAAADYARQLPDQLDLIHLGMGPDGHVASLFPGHALLHETQLRVAALTDSPKPPSARVTFTLPTLTSARELWFLVLGAAKRPAADEARTDPHSLLPAALVQRGAAHTTWFTDF